MALIFSSNRHYITRSHFVADNPEEPDGAFGQMDAGGGVFLRFAGMTFGSVAFDTAIEFDNPFVEEVGPTPIQLPPNADPPFPPVWPYTWDPSLIYGRENLTQNLRVVRGDDLRFQFTVVQDGGVVNLTGGTLTLTCRFGVDEPVLFTCTEGDGLTVPDPTLGVVDVLINSLKTSTDIPLHTVPLDYDVRFVSSADLASTVLYGVLTVYPNITELESDTP